MHFKMANYYAKSRTNYFRVNDEAQYQWLFSGLCCDDEIYDFSEEKDGVLWHAFGGRGPIDWVSPNENNEDPDYNFDGFLKQLQEILHEEDAFILEEVGSQKYCYLNGFVLIATRNDVESFELRNIATLSVQKLLKNPDYVPQLEY